MFQREELWCLLVVNFERFSTVFFISSVNFEQVNVCWAYIA